MRKMKESGIDWIGNIPQEWKVLPISSCFKERNEKVSDYEWEPLSVTKQGIVNQLETAAKSDAHDARKKVCKEDFVINSRSDRKQSCGVSEYDGSVSLINIVLENRRLNINFVKYLLKNYGFAEEFYRYGSGIVADLWSTNYQKMKKIMLPIPSEFEQDKIAKFLDKKIIEINNLIEKTKETIEDYKKLKHNTILKAITKGVNSSKELKESGNVWIGEIPNDWTMLKMNKICQIITDYVASGSFASLAENVKYIDTPDYARLIRTMDISGKYENIQPVYINEHAYNFLSNSNLFGGEIILPNIGASVGDVYIVPQLYKKMSLAPNSIMIKTRFVDKYYYYCFLCNAGRQSLISISGSTAQPKFNKTEFKTLKLPVPPMKEQKEIVKYLDNKCTEIDKLIENKQKIVGELEQYKKSLIYEYVTGKKEVV